MAIPYRLGTTDCFDVLRATENPMLCQFLIGKIQHLARIKDWSKNDNVCQFLIGKVQQWDIRDTLIDKKIIVSIPHRQSTTVNALDKSGEDFTSVNSS